MRKKFIWKEWQLPLMSLQHQIDQMDDDDDEDLFDIQQDIKKESGIELFILHTNFIITFDVVEKIIEKRLPGVEALKPLTSYKLLVGIPSSGFFKIEDVKKSIEGVFLEKDTQINDDFDNIISMMFDEDIVKNAIEIRNSLYESQDYWIFYIYPNGKFEIITDSTKSPYFAESVISIVDLSEMIGGIMITSLQYDIDYFHQ